jgi:hypothetical protein
VKAFLKFTEWGDGFGAILYIIVFGTVFTVGIVKLFTWLSQVGFFGPTCPT